MGATPAYALPYPELPEPADIPLDIKELAQRLELVLAQVTTLAAPPGVISPFAGASAPGGWLLCDGAVVPRAAPNDKLFTAIGTTYNTGGELASEFRLPNMKGRVPVGFNAIEPEFDVRGESGGTKAVQLTEAQLPNHVHPMDHDHPLAVRSLDGALGTGAALGAIAANVVIGGGGANLAVKYFSGSTGGAGSTQYHTNIQPYLTLHYIIKT